MESTTYTYRIHPNIDQEAKMLDWLEQCRRAYNYALRQRKDWINSRKCRINACSLRQEYIMSADEPYPDYYKQQNALTEAKKNIPEFKAVHSQVLQDALKRLDRAFKMRQERQFGFPRFKKVGRYRSFVFPQFKSNPITGWQIKLPKIGTMPIVLHRAIPDGFVVKQVRVLIKASGWYAQLILQSDISIPEPMPHGEPLGIDWGISSFVATSQGELIDNPRFYIQSQSKLQWLQCRLSKKQKGSKSYQALALKISLLHEKIGNQRKDFHYKTSHHLCRQAGMVFAEDLNILGLSRGMLAKHVLDAAPGQFLSILGWVCRKTGTYHQKVDAKGSSQLCPECGADVPKDLSVRIHSCPVCHVVMPRDVASGKIIVNRGIAAVEGLAVKLGVEEDSVEFR
jgi:putative transposase